HPPACTLYLHDALPISELSLESHDAKLSPSSREAGGCNMPYRKRTHRNIIAMALPARGLREVVMHILLGRNGDTEARGGQEMPVFQRGEHLGVYRGT